MGRKVEMLLSTLNTSIKSPNPAPHRYEIKIKKSNCMERTQPMALCAESPGQAPALPVRGGGGMGGSVEWRGERRVG